MHLAIRHFSKYNVIIYTRKAGPDMQNEQTPITRQAPRRRKRTKMQIFKEAYLPTIILAATIVLIVVFIIGGAIHRDSSTETQPPQTTTTTPSTAPSTEDAQAEQLKQEAANLIIRAEMLAAEYDFDGAIAALDSF